MIAPLASHLGSLLSALPAQSPSSFLDVAVIPDTTPTATVDVRANDPIPGNISNPAIASGPAGGSVSVVNNQIELTHNGAGTYVITYDSTIGVLNDPGVLTVVVTSTVAGSPPAIGANTYQMQEGGNFLADTLPIPAGTPLSDGHTGAF